MNQLNLINHLKRKIHLEIIPTNHPDIKPYKSFIWIDDKIVGQGTPEVCERSIKELKTSEYKTNLIYDLTDNNTSKHY